MSRLDIELLLRDADQISPLPESAHRLTTLFADEDWDLREIAMTVELDEALTGRLLGLANSALGGAAGTIDSVNDAVLRAGPGMILSLAMASAVRPEMVNGLPAYGMQKGSLWRHSVASALSMEVARRDCRMPVPGDGFVAALMHDIGKLVINRQLSDEGGEELFDARAKAGRDDAAAERALLGVDHAQLGGRIATRWGLPGAMPVAIAFHHRPEEAPTDEARILASYVQLANSVSHQIGEGGGEGHTRMTTACVQRLGLSRQRYDEICAGTLEGLEAVLDLYR